MNTRNRFTDKVAFVIGVGSGIGRATAHAFAAEGARVVAADLPEARHNETAQLMREPSRWGTRSSSTADRRSANE